MTAAAARRSPSSRAQLALKSESITTPAKMRTSATTNPTRILCQRSWPGMSEIWAAYALGGEDRPGTLWLTRR
jgi:hypothetical protein